MESRFRQRNDRAEKTDEMAGFDTSVFPCVGVPIRCAVPAYACGIERLLVSPKSGLEHGLERTDVPSRLSLLFGNSLYLAAALYYVVITFLGYNGQHCVSFLPIPNTLLSNVLCSIALPPPHPTPFEPHSRASHSLVHIIIRLEHAEAFSSRPVGRCWAEKGCIAGQEMPIYPLALSLPAASLIFHVIYAELHAQCPQLLQSQFTGAAYPK